MRGGAEDQARDYVKKRRDYARGAVPEYWIVDPAQESVSVLVLSDAAYVEHGRFVPGERAESPSVAGFAVDVSELFREARAG